MVRRRRGPPRGQFEATGRRSISLLTEQGASAHRVDKFDPDRLLPLERDAPVALDEIVKVNDLRFRLRL